VGRVTSKMRDCEGCKRRKEALHRMLWEAEQIVTEVADG
jgi:hypothetical protein